MRADAEDEPVSPAFDNSRSALEFALNASRAEMPRPFMNKAMAEASEMIRLETARTLRRRRAKQARGAASLTPSPIDLVLLENAPRDRRSPSAAPRPLKGLDRAHQAGYILSLLATLDPEHQLILRGLLITAYDPCGCRSPCCSGSRRNARWAEAVKGTCLHLEQVGEVTREPGKRGLSTQPEMRLAFVEQFYTKNDMTVAHAAYVGKVTTMTATRHRDWIFEYLEQTENEAWRRIDRVFDEAGVTGAFK